MELAAADLYNDLYSPSTFKMHIALRSSKEL